MTPPLHRVLSDEGFRLFFPLAALHAGLWPLVWVGLWSFDLPLARQIPAGIWHANEMIFGAWGAALLGFLTTAAPEWSDTPRLRGRPLWMLAALWGLARIAGLLGADLLVLPAMLADLAWLVLLLAYLLKVSLQQRTTRLLSFAGWLFALALAGLMARMAMLAGQAEAAAEWLRIAGLVFLGLLSLALARISVPVTNIVLDPSESTSPFRPHPGRLNLSAGLVALALAGQVAGLSPAVAGFLWIAAGAAFMDRMAEGFVGAEAFRAEIMVLMAAAGFAGAGLLGLGAAALGAPWAEAGPLHLALMGGLGLGVLAVLAIAGRFHTGQGLGLNLPTRAAFVLAGLAVLLRALPEMGLMPWPPGPLHLLAALLWAAAFLLWLADYWPAIRRLP
ncbi:MULTISPECIES: NnrS family protein [Paracoccus]|uniref:NnrS family protein n=1 Tax=Paracoccus TaxID=265 RepID=UPI001FB5733F|nr:MULTISPECIES: NnrS family protein [Paracoccus]MCJ1901746.1 NnrS family protein [Paracoccus versutus]MDF3906604.1 NnrS family protein [Paracoccus sp. AS002]